MHSKRVGVGWGIGALGTATVAPSLGTSALLAPAPPTAGCRCPLLLHLHGLGHKHGSSLFLGVLLYIVEKWLEGA